MDRRTVIKSAGGIVAASALAGCIGGDDEESSGDMTIWHELGESEEDSLENWVEEFGEETDLVVDLEEVGDLEDRVETAVASGEGPEMWPWAHDWVGNHWDRGFLYDATDDLSIDIDEEYSPAAAEAVRSPDGEAIVGLPGAGETMSLFYNPELVDGEPETFDDVVSIAEDYHNPQNGEYGFSQDVNAYTCSWALQAFGGYYFDVDDDGNAMLGLEDSELHEGMELFRDNLFEYMPQDLDYDAQVDTFVNGNSPLHFNGPWAVGDFDDQDASYEIAPLPELDGGEFSPYTGIDVWYFSDMLSEDEDRRDATIEFAEWYTTSTEIQEYYAENHSYIPVHSSVDPDNLPDTVAPFQQAFEQGVPMPVDARMNQVWEPLEDAITEVLTADADIADAFSSAADSIRDSWDE